jgi:hypothetical protein
VDRFNVVTNRMRASFAGLGDWLHGCSHHRTSFPITLREQPGKHAETYIVCFECGRHLAYNWVAMRRSTRGERVQQQDLELLPAFSETSRTSR